MLHVELLERGVELLGARRARRGDAFLRRRETGLDNVVDEVVTLLGDILYSRTSGLGGEEHHCARGDVLDPGGDIAVDLHRGPLGLARRQRVLKPEEATTSRKRAVVGSAGLDSRMGAKGLSGHQSP